MSETFPAALRLAIGARIRVNRKALRLSQETLAKSADLSRGQIANVELGRIQPSLPALLRIAWALDLEPARLLPDLEDLAIEWGE